MSSVSVTLVTLLKPLDGMRCHLARTLVVPSNTVLVRGPGLPQEGEIWGESPQFAAYSVYHQITLALAAVLNCNCNYSASSRKLQWVLGSDAVSSLYVEYVQTTIICPHRLAHRFHPNDSPRSVFYASANVVTHGIMYLGCS